MTHPFRFSALAFVLIGTLGSVGVLHGLWTDRWSEPEEGQSIAEMEKLPLMIGSWEGKTFEMTAEDRRFYGTGNVLARHYVNQDDGETLSVMLFRGKPGPMVIRHLPTECYISNGYEIESPPKRVLLDRSDSDAPDEFKVATFRKANEASPLRVRVHWSWSGDGPWRTPDHPRFTFARHRVLYKVYVSRTLPTDDIEPSGTAIREFMKDLTQATRESLFAAAAN